MYNKLVLASLVVLNIATLVKALSFSTNEEETRIFGGSNTKGGEYLYVAGIHSNGPKSELFCGGVLIAPEYILTAGHCLDMPMTDVYVTIGSTSWLGGTSREAQTIRVIKAYRHPRYFIQIELVGVTHDVAVLKLETPSKLQPASLPTIDEYNYKPGIIATVLGWGLINNDTVANDLQAVDIAVLSNKKCAQLFANAKDRTTVDASVICAGTGHGKDACVGDSGGPLMINDVVVGIVSAGPNVCGVLPSTYARVSFVLDFINDIVRGGETGDVTDLLTNGSLLRLSSALQNEGEVDTYSATLEV
ncbi:hypothetical protein CCR75_007917 [Bremia lactucae]|uniref:Peptidase S1 domain-containing protein n=1 Tax=Bremia lactucae TaxID=4779 RepID=A0A976FR46_BRELC|nr:hypothetical protein CCR75_007917 [Bremia lactucae]